MSLSLSVITTTDPVARQLPELLAALSLLAGQRGDDIEVVIVDDLGWNPLEDGNSPPDWPGLTIRMIRQTTPEGQLSSMLEGVLAASGDYLFTLDPDMHPCIPELPAMEALLRQGHRIVHGCRSQRHDLSWWRRMGSALANRLVRRLTGLHVEDIGSPVMLMERQLLLDAAELLRRPGNPRLRLYQRHRHQLTCYRLQHGSRSDSRSQYSLVALVSAFIALLRDSARS